MSVNEGRLGRVRHVDGHRVFVNLAEGGLAWFDSPDAHMWTRGQVILLPQQGPAERGADELWVNGSDTGTVQAVTEDVAFIEIDGKLRAYEQPSDRPWVRGQTVILEEDGAPGPAILEDPIDRYGLGTRNDFDVSTLLAGSDLTISLADFGGQRPLVRRALELIDAALDMDGRFEKLGAKPPKGVLFSGPAGTGKTFLAQALANYASADFYNVGGPELVDQYVGQSEKRLRDLFEHAYANPPAVLFFDEIDSMFSQRADDTPEYANRLVGQFLALLDGFRSHRGVMVIATSNLRNRLDRALMRPGRFGHELIFDLPDEANRADVLTASARKLNFSEEIDLPLLAHETHGWSAADLTSIWTDAALLAHVDGRDAICSEDVQIAFEALQASRTRIASLSADEEIE